jgi:hypothetical protein
MIDAMRTKYREIRRQVYERATEPITADEERHTRNKATFQHAVTAGCNRADLTHYNAATALARTELWNHLWTKNRYAGIRSQTATREIAQLTPLFNNYRWFCEAGWDMTSNGHIVQSAGSLARSFLERTGQFAGKQTIGNVPKLRKIVAVARAYTRYFEDHPDAAAIEFVTRGLAPDDIWAVHEQLLEVGYTADLTALHFMMDAGFPVIKPDVVMSRLFFEWGWLHHAIPSLPADLRRDDLTGKGAYGTRYLYTKPTIYKPVINLARQIVRELDVAALSADIGWATNNPIREFDIFVVKAGQLPEKEIGIERRLYP